MTTAVQEQTETRREWKPMWDFSDHPDTHRHYGVVLERNYLVLLTSTDGEEWFPTTHLPIEMVWHMNEILQRGDLPKRWSVEYPLPVVNGIMTIP